MKSTFGGFLKQLQHRQRDSQPLPSTLGEVPFGTRPIGEYAALAKLPYEHGEAAQVPAGWSYVDTGEVAKKMQAFEGVQSKGEGYVGLPTKGVNVQLLRRDDEHGNPMVAVVFGGTNSTSTDGEHARVTQWAHNAQNAVSGPGENLQFSAEVTKAVQEMFPDARVVTVGHSKGGLEANWAAIHNKVEGITFNAQPASSALMKQIQALQEKGVQQGQLLALHNDFDPVFHLPGTHPAGTILTVNTGAGERSAKALDNAMSDYGDPTSMDIADDMGRLGLVAKAAGKEALAVHSKLDMFTKAPLNQAQAVLGNYKILDEVRKLHSQRAAQAEKPPMPEQKHGRGHS
ncbi:hypothetical protein FNU76_15105 [Chitinimonas arctica]|uniref:DUF2974 domain-containing protein n=1 Tax=Chitinimonas arctica TaxID=2594795 RepID=A0A516SHD3_9NEIS|nr:hypothetical protein [Chitinimonas arctica]QDQ27574.1 hypothetical protein FNU76_15105 [Chitinimonas arctica]